MHRKFNTELWYSCALLHSNLTKNSASFAKFTTICWLFGSGFLFMPPCRVACSVFTMSGRYVDVWSCCCYRLPAVWWLIDWWLVIPSFRLLEIARQINLQDKWQLATVSPVNWHKKPTYGKRKKRSSIKSRTHKLGPTNTTKIVHVKFRQMTEIPHATVDRHS